MLLLSIPRAHAKSARETHTNVKHTLTRARAVKNCTARTRMSEKKEIRRRRGWRINNARHQEDKNVREGEREQKKTTKSGYLMLLFDEHHGNNNNNTKQDEKVRKQNRAPEPKNFLLYRLVNIYKIKDKKQKRGDAQDNKKRKEGSKERREENESRAQRAHTHTQTRQVYSCDVGSEEQVRAQHNNNNNKTKLKRSSVGFENPTRAITMWARTKKTMVI